MSIKRYTASKDTTITNAFEANLRTRGTGSNMGASDVVEVFSIFAQASTSSSEISRILMEFPVSQIVADRTAGKIPASGSVDFYMKLTNAKHPETLPSDFTLNVSPVSQSWEEGNGLDMETYTDLTRDGVGANWENAGEGVQWTAQGGDFLPSPLFNQTFRNGFEDMEINITSLVEQWINNSVPNYGVGIRLSGTQESGGQRSYYTKRFFGRGSEFFFRRPHIEARWNSSMQDDRGKFVLSSSLLTVDENTNTLYLYNVVGGQLRNIPAVGTGSIFVDIYTQKSGGTKINATAITGGYVETGVYTASIALTTTEEVIYDRWYKGSQVFHTGVIEPISHKAMNLAPTTLKYVTAISNLKTQYDPVEVARFRMFSRLKNWSPSIYKVATQNVENQIIENAYYKVFRITDGIDIIPYGTGSTNHTKMSYDVSGNYFDLDMSLLEPGYSYGIRVLFAFQEDFEEQPYVFRFRVENEF